MATWINHVAIAAPRNGTTSHTVSPSSGTVVTGTLFTPTAGRLLVCVVSGSVTSSTPSGWTLPTNGSAVSNSGLYVWHRAAAGNDSLTTNHNVGNYPILFDFYEFETGSTFAGSASAVTVSPTGAQAGPTLSGLSGSNWTAGAFSFAVVGTTGTASVAWAAGVEQVDTFTPNATTDGYVYSLTATENDASASRSYTATMTTSATMAGSGERLVFAVNAAEAIPGDAVDLDLTYVGSTAWAAPASSATVAPTYPTGVQVGDVVYAELVVKPDTATVATPANWQLVTSAAVGGGTQGAGTGAVRVHLYRRIADSALSGTQS